MWHDIKKERPKNGQVVIAKNFVNYSIKVFYDNSYMPDFSHWIEFPVDGWKPIAEALNEDIREVIVASGYNKFKADRIWSFASHSTGLCDIDGMYLNYCVLPKIPEGCID